VEIPVTASKIHEFISRLSERHILKKSPQPYVDQFISAALNVYTGSKLAKALQHKFFIPDDSAYSDDAFFQSASELTVSNHIKQASISGFDIEKRLNPTNLKNVDSYFELGAFKVAVEVKSPVEANQAISGDFIFKTAGRVPNHHQKYEELSPFLARASPTKRVILGKNKDCTSKDFLLLANEKFDPASGVDHLNILFVACGYIDDIANWYMHLFAPEGLFTANSFHPPVDFRNVDTVVLSNLKYCHEHCRDCKNPHDWTLRNVFLLPCVNPHARSSMTREALFSGLSIFDHHLTEFLVFESDNTGVPPGFFDAAKALHYLRGFLDRPRKNQYFPVKLARNDY
jgi:hypothetical protein